MNEAAREGVQNIGRLFQLIDFDPFIDGVRLLNGTGAKHNRRRFPRRIRPRIGAVRNADAVPRVPMLLNHLGQSLGEVTVNPIRHARSRGIGFFVSHCHVGYGFVQEPFKVLPRDLPVFAWDNPTIDLDRTLIGYDVDTHSALDTA